MIKLLLIEDNHDYASVIKNELEFFIGDYKVAVANNGRIGIELYKSFLPDIIASDINMPVMNGFEMVKLIRKIDLKIPVIFFTGLNNPKNVMTSYELGDTYYIKKPFHIDEFDAHIKGILKSREKAVKNKYKVGSYTFIRDSGFLRNEKTKSNVSLSELDSRLFYMLVSNVNTLVLKETICDLLWTVENDKQVDLDGRVYVHINNLRAYLKEDPNVKIIALNGKGYKLVVNGKR